MKPQLKAFFNSIEFKKASKPIKEIVESVVNQMIMGCGGFEEMKMAKTPKFSSSKEVSDNVCLFFKNKQTLVEKIIHDTYKANVTSANKSINPADLITLTKKKLTELEQEGSLIVPEFDNLLSELQFNINIQKNKMIRPVLPDATSMSSKDFGNNEYTGIEMLFSHLRLNHLSLKRYIKNKKLDEDFKGANFSRAWQFDFNKPLAVIEQQDLTAKRVSTAYVKYPYDSSYKDLLIELEEFNKKACITEKDIINKGIISLFQTGKLDTTLNISSDFERFLTIFTYHLFGIEVQRHPAAAIHNVIALDLIYKHNHKLKETLLKLPMSMEGAVKIARTLQEELKDNLSIPYFYDKALGKSITATKHQVQNFVEQEKVLILKLMEAYKLETPHSIIKKINQLCKEYYGISVACNDEEQCSYKGYDNSVQNTSNYILPVQNISGYDNSVQNTINYIQPLQNTLGYNNSIQNASNYILPVQNILGYNNLVQVGYGVSDSDNVINSLLENEDLKSLVRRVAEEEKCDQLLLKELVEKVCNEDSMTILIILNEAKDYQDHTTASNLMSIKGEEGAKELIEEVLSSTEGGDKYSRRFYKEVFKETFSVELSGSSSDSEQSDSSSD